jgi:hypothetical protein
MKEETKTNYTPVMQIGRFPVGIVAWIEAPSVHVKLVAENEVVGRSVDERSAGVCGPGRRWIDQAYSHVRRSGSVNEKTALFTFVAEHVRNLAASVDPA